MTFSTFLLIPLGLISAFIFWKRRWRAMPESRFIQDGDSLIIGDRRCRLAGVDAPEWDQPGGRAAKAYLMKVIAEQKKPGYRVFGADRYGRLSVRLIGDDGSDLNRRMVRDGFARAYTRYSLSYLPAELAARRAGAGLWSKGQLDVMPEAHRHSA